MDTGYSWIIMTGSFIDYFVIGGTMKTFGILYTELLETYDRDAGNMAFIASIQIFMTALVGPLAGFISTTYSFRLITFVGGLLAAIGMSTSALAVNPEMFILTYSILIGVGYGLVYCPVVTIVNFYFDKRRALANGIVVSSGGLTSFVFPVLYRHLFDKYGLQGGLLIIGAICFNMCVGATMYRQPKCFMEQRLIRIENKSNPCLTCCKMTCSHMRTLLHTFRTIVKNLTYKLYAVAFACAWLGYAGSFVIIPPHLRLRGVEKSDVVLMLMSTGGGELVGRIVIGQLIDRKYVKPDIMYITVMGLSGTFCIIFPWFNSLAAFYLYCVLVGILPGSTMLLLPLMIIPVTGLQLLPQAFALATVFNNSLYLLGVPITGWLEDLTGNWNSSFYFLGSVQLIAVVCVCIGRHFLNNEQVSRDSSDVSKDMKLVNQHMENKPMLTDISET